MAKKGKAARGSKDDDTCCGPDCCRGEGCCGVPSAGCCQVEAVVRVDGRGQMVLPKAVRDRAGIRPDDKLAVVSWSGEGQSCCLTLLRADGLADAVRKAYGPMLREIVRA